MCSWTPQILTVLSQWQQSSQVAGVGDRSFRLPRLAPECEVLHLWRDYPVMQPRAQLPAVCATGLAAAAGWSSVLSISSNVRPLVSGPNAQKQITPSMSQDEKKTNT